MQNQKIKNSTSTVIHQAADQRIDITYYTDPLCCWSWAFEPELDKIKMLLGNNATLQYRMGGLLPSWTNFHDPINSVSRPAQMGPVWMHAGQVSNRPITHQLWIKDPPASSYPACIAVKCAQLQSSAAGEKYLRLLRTACMAEEKNIAKKNMLLQAAEVLAKEDTDFDLQRFKTDLVNDAGLEAFREDMQQVRYHNINRFPTLIIRAANGKAILVSGYRQSSDVLNAINALYPEKHVEL